MTGGRLVESVAFDSPTVSADGSGGQETTWTEQYACRAEFRYMRGGEAVEASRLSGNPVYKVKVRSCDDAEAITTDWRMRDVRRSVTYNIREVDAVTDRAWVWLIVEGGVAV